VGARVSSCVHGSGGIVTVLRAGFYVLVIMLTGYLVGAASVDRIAAWWGTMPV
jgi:hypothetical protein